MASADSLKFELEGRLKDLGTKYHLSVRWEQGPGICRVGVCIHDYSWEMREQVLDRILAFEQDHRDELAVEVDIVPLEAVNTVGFAEV